MIIEGKSRGKGKGAFCLATHLLKPENDRIRIVEARGTCNHDDLDETFSDWQTIGWSIGCKKALYHANISPDETVRLTEEQKLTAVDRLESELGFVGQPRVIVEHEKKGREHLHVVWLRIDTDRMRVLSDSFNYAKHERVATELEQTFGLKQTPRALTREEGETRPRRAPSKAELQQAQRSGLDPREAKRQLTALWYASATAGEFRDNLERAGWHLAKGDRTAYVAVDYHGNVHALARRIDGVRTPQIREKLSELGALPTVGEARAIQLTRSMPSADAHDGFDRLATQLGMAHRAGDRTLHIEKKRQKRAARDAGDGDMVSEQRAAQFRFAWNSAALEANRDQDAPSPSISPPEPDPNETPQARHERLRRESIDRYRSTPEQRLELSRGGGISRGRSR